MSATAGRNCRSATSKGHSRQYRIDVVHVLTPPAAHTAVAIQAAEAGCDVLVEKPMALDVAEADRIIDAARAAGVRVVPNHNYLFKPSIERARDDRRLG